MSKDLETYDGGLTLRDKRLLEAAANGWSAVEIEEAYAIPAATALVRIREILKARNVFSDIERKQLLLFSMFQLKEKIESEALDLDNPRSVEAYTKVIKSLNDMLEKQTAITQEEMQAAAVAQARALLGLIEQAYGRVREWLVEEFGQDLAEIADERFHQALREIAAEESDE